MESPSTFKQPPVETVTHEVKVSDVVRQERNPSENLLGAVVVGGRYSADCFIPEDTDGDYDWNISD